MVALLSRDVKPIGCGCHVNPLVTAKAIVVDKLFNVPFLLTGPYCFVILLVIVTSLVAGCATQQPSLGTGKYTYRILPDQYTEKALDYEKKGFLREAMQSWWIVQSFYPGDSRIKERIKTLRKKSKGKARDHFQKGEEFYQNGLIMDARREFLLALTYDQNHGQALDYLQNKLQQPVLTTYTVQQGDTLRKVADKIFHDPAKVFLITSFNDIDSSGKLIPRTTLQIPLLGEDFPSKEKFSLVIPAQNDDMQAAPRRQKKTAVAKVSPKRTNAKKNQQAEKKKSDAASELNYQKAREFLEQEEYQKSLQVLRSVDINFRDVRKLIASTEVFLQQEADAHYRKGISYFLTEKLDKAIQEWEEVLRLSPSHLKAKKDLRNARKLRQKVMKY